MRRHLFIVWQQLFAFLLCMALGKHYVAAAKVCGALVILVAIGVLCADLPARAEADAPLAPPLLGSPSVRSVRVIDGDTLENTVLGVRYRLQNVNAATTGSLAQCDAERERGEAATAAAQALVGRARILDVSPTGRIDSAGQAIVFVSLDGRDLGELLMAQGVVRPAGASAPSWCVTSGASLS